MSIEIDEIKKVNLSDGDVLILYIDHLALRSKQRAAIAEQFKGLFPHNKVLILDKGFSLGVLTKKDIEGM